MDLSDLSSTHTTDESVARDASTSATAPLDAAWRLANQIGDEVACALTPALNSVRQMQATGRIDRVGLHALISQIEQARHASLVGQQVARLARGPIEQQPETLNLSQVLRDVVAQRQAELNERGVAVQHTAKPVEVMADKTLLSALLNTLFEWSLRHACTPVDIALDVKAWPAHAQIVCRYGHTPTDWVQTPSALRHPTRLDCLSWQLLMQLAGAMALRVDRADTDSDTVLTLEFPHTVNGSLEGAAAIEWNAPPAAGNSP
ncbi:MAG TPA: hypothetical protein VLE45_15025, partial [Burkholderiaceae bacterium]|nr:hypothetical protein [Burkholderiaceae bacterium]